MVTFDLFLSLVISPCCVRNIEVVNTQHNYLVYEPADFTVHPPELPRVGLFFSYRCLVFPKNMSSKERLNISELFRFKDVFLQHIHTNPILINLTFLDNNE